MAQFRLAIALLIAVLMNVAQVSESVQEFKRCYNTSEDETHCFDVQFDNATNQLLRTSFQNAQMRCRDLNSTLVIIENEEISNLIRQFVTDNNPINERYVWLNAYQINDFYNYPNRWHWLNSTLPNLIDSTVSYTYDSGWYTAVLEFRSDGGKSQYYLTARQPIVTANYVCEYAGSNCSSTNSSDERIINGRCYIAVQGSVTWYEARNRCLKGGGDLASFANVTNINFTSWLGSDAYDVRYWIGLRFIWYTWGDSGPEFKYTNWATNDGNWESPCLILCNNCVPTLSWSTKACSTTDSIYVVCHTITSVRMTTTSTIGMVSTTQTTIQPAATSTLKGATLAKMEATTSSIIPVAVGVGVGVGVPVIAGIVIIATFVVRKRRHVTTSARQSSNHQQRESSFDQSIESPTVTEKDEAGQSAYGTVVSSSFSGQKAETSGAHSATDQTEYAPLQFL